MKRETPLINTCEKLKERSYISCGKDSKRYYESFASTGVFTIANSSACSSASQYSGAIKACKKACQIHHDCQIYHLI